MTASVRPTSGVGGESDHVLTAAAIAEAVAGELVGNPETAITAIAPLDRATASDLSFLAAPKYARQLESTNAGVVLIAPELATAPGDVRARVIVARPHEALLGLLPRLYRAPAREAGVSPSAIIGRGARLGSAVRIGPFAVIGDRAVLGDGVTIDAHVTVGPGVEIGADSHLYPTATIYSGAMIGKRVVIHAGARIASDGFGYVFRDGAHLKLPHVGRCIIEDDVEIGANSTIDRGSIDDTVVGAGTKIDNLVHVAHNVRIGRLCLIMAQVGIAGSVHVEDGCTLAGQVGVSGHHTVGAGATLAAQAGVFGDIPAGEVWSGWPARPHKDQLRAQSALFKLSKLMRRIERMLERSERETGP
ncbi:MAG TPA: UDP-3-O-(3-hydroxymyristoyl)glucosamine N-acyltransferase [Gemmatimonadaceae bacterium]|nr:UDP-3-O-(3-hydroxymyristoyl)glucosamine N-acyltransferase [Gemmatimonadaceae bacterium]